MMTKCVWSPTSPSLFAMCSSECKTVSSLHLLSSWFWLLILKGSCKKKRSFYGQADCKGWPLPLTVRLIWNCSKKHPDFENQVFPLHCWQLHFGFCLGVNLRGQGCILHCLKIGPQARTITTTHHLRSGPISTSSHFWSIAQNQHSAHTKNSI